MSALSNLHHIFVCSDKSDTVGYKGGLFFISFLTDSMTESGKESGIPFTLKEIKGRALLIALSVSTSALGGWVSDEGKEGGVGSTEVSSSFEKPKNRLIA